MINTPLSRDVAVDDIDSRCLEFKPFTSSDITMTSRLAAMSRSRACDFTVGGIYMWIDYFRYTRCFVNDTLFIKGVNEDDTTLTAFSLPVGLMPLADSVALLKEYCSCIGMPLRFSAVPEGRLDELTALGARSVTELTDWADYLYDINSLATLKGKRYNKKRNHVNRFMAENHGYTLRDLTIGDIPAVTEFLDNLPQNDNKPLMARYERDQVRHILTNYKDYPFEGGVLTTPAHGIVAFTIGEIISDTLHLHIEKIDHETAGAGEAINTLFARAMMTRHGQLTTINRQDDAGDPGLRHAKMSYHPQSILRKYNVIF